MSGSLGTALMDASVAERAAEAVLRAAGGRMVLLRTPANAAAGDSEQLGLATPQFRDAPVGPAAFRKVGGTKVLMISARGLRVALHTVGAASVKAMLQEAAGVVIEGELYRVEQVVAMGPVGTPYCWAVTLVAPVV